MLEIDHAARSEADAQADLFKRAAATAREQGLHYTLTTGEVARLFDVATRTVTRWFDTGYIKGWRIPGSKDRRFVIAELIAFCQREQIPLPPGVRADLLIGGAPTLHAELAAASWHTGQVDTVHSAVEMAHRLGRHPYAACLAGPGLGRYDLREVARAAQGLATRLVYVQGDDDPCPQEMRDAGWVLTWGDPENALGALLGRATP